MKKDRLTLQAENAILSGTRLTWRHHWALLKRRLIQFLGALIMEKDSDGTMVVSLSRVSWWLLLIPAIYVWVSSGGKLDAGAAVKDISPNHFNMLMILAGYTFGKKITDTAQMFINSRRVVQQPYIPQPIPIQPDTDNGNEPRPPSERWG